MSQITPKLLPPPQNNRERDLFLVLSEFILDVKKILNNGVTFSENFDATAKSLTTSATPDAENTLAHGLGKVPTGYIVVKQDKAGSLYDSGTAWTTTNIYLKCDIASVTFSVIIY